MAVAQGSVHRNHIRHGLFFAHLGLEKALNAHVCRTIKDIPPRMHNLIRLAELADLNPKPAYVDILAERNSFNIEGRYPDTLSLPPT
jgi:HEPN domain-containing protein